MTYLFISKIKHLDVILIENYTGIYNNFTQGSINIIAWSLNKEISLYKIDRNIE